MDGRCKCEKCGKYYDKTNNPTDSCVYHSGVYMVAEPTPMLITTGKWSCCKKLQRGDVGCKRTAHEENYDTTTMLNTFANSSYYLSTARPQREKIEEPQPAPVIVVDIPDVELEGGYIQHYVKTTDTLQGLALKYNSTVDRIKKANAIFHSTHIHQKYIYIPSSDSKIELSPQFTQKTAKPPSKNKLAKKLMIAVGCEREEALYYVDIANSDYNLALEKFHEDEKWAKSVKKLGTVKGMKED